MKLPTIKEATERAQSFADREGLICIGLRLDLNEGLFRWKGEFVTPELTDAHTVVLIP